MDRPRKGRLWHDFHSQREHKGFIFEEIREEVVTIQTVFIDDNGY